MASVYIETSVPGYYCETRTSAEATVWRRATRRWWDVYRHDFNLCTSEVTIQELARAPKEKASAGLAMLKGVEVLATDDVSNHAAAYYLTHRLLPGYAIADALHLAIASRRAVDFVLTWNIKHLANPNKSKHLSVLNARLRLHTPTLITPLTLLPEIDS